MKQPESTKVLHAFTYEKPVMLEGNGFDAMNYGAEYSKIRGGNRKLAIRSNEVSYLSLSPEASFPAGVYFQKYGPNMAFTEATHVGPIESVKVSATFDELMHLLKMHGMKFED